MRWRQVLVLYAVLAALGAEYWFVERHRQPVETTRPARQRLLTVERRDLREVRLTRGGRAIVARVTGGQWTVVEPADAPIPPDLVAAFVEALLVAEEIDVVPDAGGDDTAFGFDATAARVELMLDGGRSEVMTIGAPNPTGTLVYTRRGEVAAVVLIGRNVRYYEDLLFDALPAPRVPADAQTAPIGG